MPPFTSSLTHPSTLFPTYLLPTLPFRRKSSSDSSASTDTTIPDDAAYLTGHASHLRCARCAADLALATQIISKGFTGRHGRAYLVAPSSSSNNTTGLPNTYTHKPVPRHLVTGAHTVGDISCAHCGSVLGWKYVWAAEEAQRYKVGKFILETKRVCRTATWEEENNKTAEEEKAVEFDSEDEEECEDLFMGVWTPQLAARRRRARRFGE